MKEETREGYKKRRDLKRCEEARDGLREIRCVCPARQKSGERAREGEARESGGERGRE